jgi:hypothetical protein
MLAVVVVLAGCGPRAGGGEIAAAAGPADVVVDLPAVYVDIGADGIGRIAGMKVSDAGKLIGRTLPDVKIPTRVLDALKNYDIQHLQLVNTPEGLDILVNGLRMPSLGWNAAVLSNLRSLLDGFGADFGSAGNLLPLLGNLGAGVVLRLPVEEGKKLVPLVSEQAAATAEKAQAALEEFKASVGDVPVIHFTVEYDPQGKWTVQGKDAAEWEEVLPIGWDGFNLDAEIIQGAVKAGVSEVAISTSEEGISVSVNEMPLPIVTWNSGEITNVLRLLQESGLLGELAGDNPQITGIISLVESVLPTIQTADFSMTVKFPPSE